MMIMVIEDTLHPGVHLVPVFFGAKPIQIANCNILPGFVLPTLNSMQRAAVDRHCLSAAHTPAHQGPELRPEQHHITQVLRRLGMKERSHPGGDWRAASAPELLISFVIVPSILFDGQPHI